VSLHRVVPGFIRYLLVSTSFRKPSLSAFTRALGAVNRPSFSLVPFSRTKEDRESKSMLFSEWNSHSCKEEGQQCTRSGTNSLLGRAIRLSLRSASRPQVETGSMVPTAAYAQHRRFLLLKIFSRPFATMSGGAAGSSIATSGVVAGVHAMYRFALWCSKNQIYLHPSVKMRHSPSLFRDHRFYLGCEAIPRHCPLVAIPEGLVIGYKDATKDSPEIEFRKPAEEPTTSSNSATDPSKDDQEDICSFFFTSLGLLISDLLVALNSKETDLRHFFAFSLHRLRTLQNAPYLDNVVFDRNETCLADVVLQMVRNFINAGPLSGKVSRQELLWATSVAMSHSTPLSFGTRSPSIGILPLIHMFPHGGKQTNCVLLANRGSKSAERIQQTIQQQFSFQFPPETIFVVPFRSIRPYAEVALQPMAPCCNLDASNVDESTERMWILSCGADPKEGLSAAQLAAVEDQVYSRFVNLSS
jgi:hypothetical protein